MGINHVIHGDYPFLECHTRMVIASTITRCILILDKHPDNQIFIYKDGDVYTEMAGGNDFIEINFIE